MAERVPRPPEVPYEQMVSPHNEMMLDRPTSTQNLIGRPLLEGHGVLFVKKL